MMPESSSHCPELYLLEAFAAGTASADEQAGIEKHVERCAECTAALEKISADLELEGRMHALFAPAVSETFDTQIEGYRIVRELGRGGMGVVFEAEQISPPRRVALKIVRGGAWIDPATHKLFQREIRVLARLEHQSIVPLYDAGTTSHGEHYFAMELVRGDPLATHVQTLSRRERLELFRQIADAIDYAHQRGVIHRD